MVAMDWRNADSASFGWNRSLSEPDLTAPRKHKNRFGIHQPHEYISVDDLKYFRRRQPTDFHTHSNFCLYNSDEPTLPFSILKSEYTRQFGALVLGTRPPLLRRATSLRLEGSMRLQSEHQEQFHWFTPEDWKFSRTYPVRNPETLHLTGDNSNMGAEYRSSYITHPMVDRTMKILPREVFEIDAEPKSQRSSNEAAAINKLATDKFQRDLAAREQQLCHLQERTKREPRHEPEPSEYKQQFQQPFPIEKAHSIPQMSSIRMQGEFVTVPEYQDSFKMYANYSKSAPIKKTDNLRISGAEVQASPTPTTTDIVPEYRDKFNDPPKNVPKEKSLKTDDHLHPRGEFTKDVPEYNESFRDPQIKEMPERGKCREPYLRLKGKIEFNPEYRNTYLDFPRSRPIVRKPASSFRLPTSTSTTTTTAMTNTVAMDNQKSPQRTPRRAFKSSSPQRADSTSMAQSADTDITITPEYRRAQYNYQLRERTPPRKIIESDGGGNMSKSRKPSDSSSLEALGRQPPTQKRRPSRHRLASMQNTTAAQQSFDNMAKKPAKFGRRASVLQNAANCREKSSIIEGNPKYTVGSRRQRYCDNQPGSFVVLDEPCKGSNWMKKTWYDS